MFLILISIYTNVYFIWWIVTNISTRICLLYAIAITLICASSNVKGKWPVIYMWMMKHIFLNTVLNIHLIRKLWSRVNVKLDLHKLTTILFATFGSVSYWAKSVLHFSLPFYQFLWCHFLCGNHRRAPLELVINGSISGHGRRVLNSVRSQSDNYFQSTDIKNYLHISQTL